MGRATYQKYSTLVEFGCTAAGFVGGSIAGGLLSEGFDVPRYANYLSSTAGAVAGALAGLHASYYASKGLERIIFGKIK